MKLFVLALFLAILLNASGVSAKGHTVSADAAGQLVVGKIAGASTKHYNRLSLFSGYLAQAMHTEGIRKGGVKIAASIGEMKELLREGRVDVLSETAFGALQLIDTGYAELLLVEWKRGRAAYRSVFFVRADSKIETLADLVGRRIAMEDPNSTSAFFLPVAELLRNGIGATRLDAADAPNVAGKAGYLFAYQEIGQAVMVNNGLADAGVFSDGDWSKLSAMTNGIADNLRIIHQTEEVFRSALLVRRSLPSGTKARLKAVLLKMPATDVGRQVLASYYRVTEYEELSGAAAETVARARSLYRLFQGAK